MEGGSIEFSANYNGWVVAKKLDGSSDSNSLLRFLAQIRDSSESKAFHLLFDTKDIDSLIDKTVGPLLNGKKASALPIQERLHVFSKAVPIVESPEMKKTIIAMFKDKEKKVSQNLKKVANSYTLWRISDLLFLNLNDNAGTNKPEKGEAPDSRIDFFANWGKWVSIKKMTILKETKPEEVAIHLASIGDSIDKKIFELFPEDAKAKLSKYIEDLSKGKSSKMADLSNVAESLSSKDAKDLVEKSVGSSNTGIGYAYILCSAMKNLGFEYKASLEFIGKAYPELKVKKPPGRKRKA